MGRRIGHVKRMDESCFPKHSRMGAARTKYKKETDEECKKRGEYGKKQSRHEEKKTRRPVTHPNQNIIIINII